MTRLLIAAASVLALNLPFGFWRAGVRRFTPSWILAVHAPVPLVVGVRLVSGLGWHLATFPVLVGAFFTGQFVGGKLRSLLLRVPDRLRESDPLVGP
jgi:hypothetical protein